MEPRVHSSQLCWRIQILTRSKADPVAPIKNLGNVRARNPATGSVRIVLGPGTVLRVAISGPTQGTETKHTCGYIVLIHLGALCGGDIWASLVTANPADVAGLIIAALRLQQDHVCM